MKTAVTEMLDASGVEYVIKPHAEPALTAETAAHERGVRVSQIVKCMVGQTDADSFVVMLIPGDKKLKSSKARKYLRASALELVPPETLSERFGLTVGAIAPQQLIGKARMLMDPAVLEEEMVDISSGDPMAGVELRATDLQSTLGAEIVAMTSQNS